RCAIEIAHALKTSPQIQLRIGMHSGPVNAVADLNQRENVAGAGINMAQRIMDCGDAGHILLSRHVAEDLEQDDEWQPCLHDLGEAEVKHGVKLHVVSFYNGEIGNAEVPQKLKIARKHATAVRRRYLLASAVVLVLAAAVFMIYRSRDAVNGQTIPQKSIAVLPFENISADKENGFFSDGIQDDLLTSLAMIRDLRVISRTSVQRYRGAENARSLADIAKTLGTANVLEGSVRRAGNRVVVNVQLIDALHDRQLWANHYDRTIANSLGLQGELAREIADALKATLTPEETARVEIKPTNNAQAYDLYLQARVYEFKPDTFLQDYRTAEQLYVQAITIDPSFALAHARLAATRARIYHFFEPTETWSKSARLEANKALELQPNLGEAHHALGLCYYWFDRDYARALREFEIARQLLPNDSSVPWDIAAIKRRQGKWQEAVANYRAILVLDPENANVVRDLLYTYCAMRDWPNTMQMAQRLLALTPDSINAKAQIGYVKFFADGTTARLKSEMASVPAGEDPDGAVTGFSLDAAFIDRDTAGADKALANSPLESFSYFNEVDTPRSYFTGVVALLRGDLTGARENFAKVRDSFAALSKEAPDAPERHAFLGFVCALLGEKERAIAEGKRAVELRPESQDALDGTVMEAVLAMIYARTGENDRALELLLHLLAVPGPVDTANYSITLNDLKHRWEWDPLRNDARFQQLLASKQ
ncbi:MAG: hypothetical protein JO354_02155, partial [Verrucomicrobia bacterium]|nr:hypothetical protein [Verrucomicrobiota bacterium]